MSTAFVLSGGGSLGSVQVGMLLALAERGITPDLVVGTSVGAINAAWIAGRPGVEGARELADVWTSVHRGDIFPARPVTGLLGFLGRRDHLVPASALRTLLRRHLTYQRLEDAPIPVRVIATEVSTGLEVVLDHSNAVDAVTASAALPGVFRPVRVGNQELMDGGIVNNTPLSHAVDAGAQRIYVLPTGYACALPDGPHSALGVVLHALTLLLQQRLIADVTRYQHTVDIRVAPPLCPLSVSPADFSHTRELIERSAISTRQWLESADHDPDQTRMLSQHRHGAADLRSYAR